MDERTAMKRAAAEAAVGLISSGMRVGLGTGSTAIFALRRLGELLRSGELRDVVGFPTSRAIAEEAEHLGVPLLDEGLPEDLDLTIDGADEVDPELNVIKGGGGALLREKIAAQASRRMVIVADESKLVARLGQGWAVPVEVVSYGWESQRRFLSSLGAEVQLRLGHDGRPFRTDSRHLILDATFGPIPDPRGLAAILAGRAGVVEHGLFLGLVHDLFVAGPDGVRHSRREA